jgi:VanZ family protein
MIRNIARLSFPIGLIAVAWLSLTPRDAMPEIQMWDKLQHLMAYAVLAACGAIGFPGGRPRLIVGVGLIVFGCGLEIAQAAVPGRSSNIGDAVANIAGIALGLATAWIGDWVVGKQYGNRRASR